MYFATYMAGFAAYLFIAAIVSLIASRLAGKTKRAKVGWGVFSVFIALPLGDAVLSSMYFKYLCTTQGGTEIFSHVNNVEGYLIEGQTHISDKMVLESPYDYIEAQLRGQVKRYTKTDEGRISVEQVAVPKSLFKVQYMHTEYPFKIGKTELQVRAVKDSKLVARKTVFSARLTTFRPWLKKEPCPFSITSGSDIVLEALKAN